LIGHVFHSVTAKISHSTIAKSQTLIRYD